MEMPSRLVISHASGDEGIEYERRIRNFAEHMKAPTIFVSDIIKDERGTTDDGRKIYKLQDVYPYADLVTYPSDIEGFGNAFLEAVYFSRPIVVNNYSIYSIDIKPKGFRVIEFDGYITEETVINVRRILEEPAMVEEMVEHNYHTARKHYSYTNLENHLTMLITECFGT